LSFMVKYLSKLIGNGLADFSGGHRSGSNLYRFARPPR
jgi:hypothetical protein